MVASPENIDRDSESPVSLEIAFDSSDASDKPIAELGVDGLDQ